MKIIIKRCGATGSTRVAQASCPRRAEALRRRASGGWTGTIKLVKVVER